MHKKQLKKQGGSMNIVIEEVGERTEPTDRELAFLFCKRIMDEVSTTKGNKVFRELFQMHEFNALCRIATAYTRGVHE